MASPRWEFRTERRIQDIVGAWAEDMYLVDMAEGNMASEVYFLAEQYPEAGINTCQSTITTIEAFKARGVEVVFTGQGGDSLLADAIPADALGNGYNIGNEFILSSEADYYRECGLELVSPFADKAIIDQLTNLRRGEAEDIAKLWARRFFADILPRELSYFTYVADFMGYYIKRLEELKVQMPPLMREARALLPHPVFSEESIREMLAYSLLNLESASYFEFTAKLRVAIWLRGLRQAGIIQV